MLKKPVWRYVALFGLIGITSTYYLWPTSHQPPAVSAAPPTATPARSVVVPPKPTVPIAKPSYTHILPHQTPDWMKDYQAATANYEAKEYDNFITACQDLIPLIPSYHQAATHMRFMLAASYYYTHDYKKGLQSFDDLDLFLDKTEAIPLLNSVEKCYLHACAAYHNAYQTPTLDHLQQALQCISYCAHLTTDSAHQAILAAYKKTLHEQQLKLYLRSVQQSYEKKDYVSCLAAIRLFTTALNQHHLSADESTLITIQYYEIQSRIFLYQQPNISPVLKDEHKLYRDELYTSCEKFVKSYQYKGGTMQDQVKAIQHLQAKIKPLHKPIL